MQLMVALSANDVLYHKTHISKLNLMLKSGKIEMSPAQGADSDANVNGDYQYYLSTGRTLTAKYNYMSQGYVQLVLDKRRIQNNHRIVPIDYWGEQYRGYYNGAYEKEDRILSNKPSLSIKNILEVHYLVNDYSDTVKRDARSVMRMLKKMGIKIYLYKDKKAAQYLNKRKAISFKEAGLNTKKAPERWPDTTMTNGTTGHAYMELLNRPEIQRKHLSNKADRLRQGLRNKQGFLDALRSDINNTRSSRQPSDAKVREFLLQNAKSGRRSLESIYDHLVDKWQ